MLDRLLKYWVIGAAVIVVCSHNARAQNVVTADWLTATTGVWHEPFRWSTAPYYPDNENPPGTQYDVRITAAGVPYNVIIENPTTVNSVALGGDAVLLLGNLTTTTLSVGDRTRARFTGGRLTGANLTTSGGGRVEVTGQGRLRDVYLNGRASVASPTGELLLEGTTEFGPNGAIHLSSGGADVYASPTGLVGQGEIVFDYGSDSQTSVGTLGDTLTIGSGMTIRSAGGWGSVVGQQLVNNGQIIANAQGGALFINAVLDNRGVINALNGARMTMPAAWTNSGIVSATDNGTLVVGNVPADADLGSFFVRDSRLVFTAPTSIDRIHQLDVMNSVLQVSGGVSLDNTGRVLPVRDGTNTWQLIGGGLFGGTVVEGAPGTALITGGNASLAADVQADVHVIPGGQLSIGGGRIAGRTIRMNSGPDPSSPFTGATVLLTSTSILEPGSRIVFDGTVGTNLLRRSAAASFDVPAGVQVVTGTGGGTIVTSNGAIANNGYIGSLTAGRAITLNANAVQNAGTLEAGAGDVIALGPITGQPPQSTPMPIDLTNSGVVRLGAGGDLDITGSFLQQGDAAVADFVIGGYGEEGFGQISSSVAVALDGVLEASLAAGFEPMPGDVFTIIRTGPGGVSGTFDELRVPVWGGGTTFAVVYGAQQVDLVAVPEAGSAAVLLAAVGALYARPRRAPRRSHTGAIMA